MSLKPCTTCRYFKRTSQILTEPGECHRYPPTLFAFPITVNGQNGFHRQTFYPIVGSTADCGEHKPMFSLVEDETDKANIVGLTDGGGK